MLRLRILLGAVALALLAAACGGDDDASSNQTGATVSAASVDQFGTVLVDPSGKALYASDEEADGTVRCVDACESFWKPVSPGADMPTAQEGVPDLGVVQRPDGTQQVTADGRPLYTFSEDSPGEVTGDGFSDDFGGQVFTWHVMTADGSAVTPPASSSGSNGFGY
jgi:predicted lipoprotein with Yx(FWY)xxD motif